MISTDKLNKYGDILLWGLKKARTKKYKQNNNILIRFDISAIRLAEILQAKILDMGMIPILRISSTPQMEKNFFERANNTQLGFQPSGENEFNENLHGVISLLAPESITHLRHIDPRKIGKAALARKPLRDILWKRRKKGISDGHCVWFQHRALLKQLVSLWNNNTAQVIKACYLDMKDPVKGWEETFNNAMVIKNGSTRIKVAYYHIESENMDLKITPGEKRRWIGVSGHNIPSFFELFISPDWRGTEVFY